MNGQEFNSRVYGVVGKAGNFTNSKSLKFNGLTKP